MTEEIKEGIDTQHKDPTAKTINELKGDNKRLKLLCSELKGKHEVSELQISQKLTIYRNQLQQKEAQGAHSSDGGEIYKVQCIIKNLEEARNHELDNHQKAVATLQNLHVTKIAHLRRQHQEKMTKVIEGPSNNCSQHVLLSARWNFKIDSSLVWRCMSAIPTLCGGRGRRIVVSLRPA
ncbi:PREDICTED: thyroid receptor-interacting protein 11-like [Chinchilla lanigera]|uniref:thyroid receptor-interacting protein 11-like n=1 Tax=Chinchilla lanigera TaxID=34839 RepID=UPI00069770FC|nr:PREDICTED: thyroid receptor-interacting protein 11-like [Chinchilla lanigera]